MPGVLQTLALLQVARGDIEVAVDSALQHNPMLERAPGHPCPGCGRHLRATRCGNCVPVARNNPEAAVSPLETLRVVAACEARGDCGRAVDAVVDHLTDRGLLDADVDEVAAMHGLAVGQVAEAVRAVKAVGPLGIAERCVGDLLGAQAEELVRQGAAPHWIVPLVRRNLELVGRDDIGAAAVLFAVDPAAVVDVFATVRLRLRPLADFEATTDQRPLRAPDVYLRRDECGQLVVDTPDSGWFGLQIADVAPAVAADREARHWLHHHEQAARLLIGQLDARANVIKQVALVAAQRQSGFFSGGPSVHRDLTRSEVAHELGLHPSTVARAVSGKAVRTPDGQIIDFKDLFGTGVAVRAEIDCILRESALSDAQLTTVLAARGHLVARRTVAKYRAQMGIPAARRS